MSQLNLAEFPKKVLLIMTYKGCKDHQCKTLDKLSEKLSSKYNETDSPPPPAIGDGGNRPHLDTGGFGDVALIMPTEGGGSGGNRSPTSTIEDEISELLLELMIKNREGTVDLERIRMVRLQASKILKNLKRLETLIQEEASEDAREEIKRVIKRGIKNLLPNPEC